MSLVLHLVDRPRCARRGSPCRAGADGRLAISTFHPDHFVTYWLIPYFPSIRADRRSALPDAGGARARARGGRASGSFASRRLSGRRELDRDEALARIRGRHISTFDLLSADEIAEGTARAERELPDRIVSRLERLVAVGPPRTVPAPGCPSGAVVYTAAATL